jgi:hypothetical protein
MNRNISSLALRAVAALGICILAIQGGQQAAAQSKDMESKGAKDCCDPYCGQHRCSVFGEFLFLHPTGVNMAHAQQQNGLGGAGTVPFGRIGTVDPHYEPGARVGFDWALDGCSSIMASFTWLEANAIDVVTPPAIPTGAVGSLVHHPGTVLTASVGPVVAGYDLKFGLADIAYRRLWSGSNCGWVNYFVGARYGNLEQQFQQQGIFGGGLGGPILTQTDIDFDGAGLLIGSDFERRFGCHGFSVYGKAAASAIFGEFRSDYAMVNTATNVQLAIASWEDDRVVPTLEYELGLAWTGFCEHLRLSVGYSAMYFFNTVTTPAFVHAVQEDTYVNVDGTIALDGLVGRVQYMW